jgi:hypothetical protein
MAMKHIFIAGCKDEKQSIEWTEKSLEVSRDQKDCRWAEYSMIRDTLTIICYWENKDSFKKFWEFTRLDQQIDELFTWNCQHHIDIDEQLDTAE